MLVSIVMSFTACADIDQEQGEDEDVGSVAQAVAPPDVEPKMCSLVQASKYEEPSPGEVFVPESATQAFTNGERFQVASDTAEFGGQIRHIQKLDDDSDPANAAFNEYLVQVGLFQTTLWVGPHKKLIIDAGGHNSGLPPIVNGQLQGGGEELVKLLDAINSIEPGKPLAAGVPSHPHADHTGNLFAIQQILAQQNQDFRIISSKWYRREVLKHGYPLAVPDEGSLLWHPDLVKSRYGGFWFDGHWFGYHTPVAVAHTPADSVTITPGGTCMVVDIVQPDRLPFVNLSVVQNIDGYMTMLRYLGGLAEAGVCKQAVWGHMNVSNGPKVLEDIENAKAYMVALHQAFWAALGSLQQEGKFGPTFFPDNLEDDPNDPNDPHDYHAGPGIDRFFSEVALRMHSFMKDGFYKRIGFSASDGHFKEVLRFVFLHRLSAAAVDPNAPPGTLPPFAIPETENIPYGEHPYNDLW